VIKPVNIQIDPGPGAIVYSNQLGLDPTEVDAVAVSHCHPDHYADAQIFVEAMSQGGREKRGTFIGPKSVVTGSEDFDSCLTRYHRGLVCNMVEMRPGTETQIGDVKAVATRAQHGDPYAIGFRFSFEAGDVGYSSDTGYYPGISDQYLDTRLLILCVLRPSGSSWPGHLSSDDAVRILQETRPEMCVITHFGLRMLSANPAIEAERIRRESGIETIAAEDNMRITIGSDMKIH